MTFLLDGGLGVLLQGNEPYNNLWGSSCLLSEHGKSKILSIHKEYVNSGVDFLSTSTYQLHLEGLAERGITSPLEIQKIFDSASHLAREAAGNKTIKIVGTMGTYCSFRGSEFDGNIDIDVKELEEWHQKRVSFVAASNVDILAFETIPNLKEVKALINLSIKSSYKQPIWISLICKTATELPSGDSVKEALQLISSCSSVSFVSFNCCNPNLISPLLHLCASIVPSSKTIVVYPNSGEKYDSDLHQWFGAPSDFSIKEWKQIVSQHSLIVGGCCRVGPKQISQLKLELKKINSSKN